LERARTSEEMRRTPTDIRKKGVKYMKSNRRVKLKKFEIEIIDEYIIFL
jgi:hypothetical protein